MSCIAVSLSVLMGESYVPRRSISLPSIGGSGDPRLGVHRTGAIRRRPVGVVAASWEQSDCRHGCSRRGEARRGQARGRNRTWSQNWSSRCTPLRRPQRVAGTVGSAAPAGRWTSCFGRPSSWVALAVPPTPRNCSPPATRPVFRVHWPWWPDGRRSAWTVPRSPERSPSDHPGRVVRPGRAAGGAYP